jgi:murein DD-endopeptidase MepM/ murein hydrolase activator NlpD
VTRGTRQLVAIAAAFFAGVLVDSWLRVYGPPQPAASAPAATTIAPPPDSVATTAVTPPPGSTMGPTPAPTTAASPTPLAPLSAAAPAPVATSGRSSLRVPIDGMDLEAMKGGFAEKRTGHPHEAVDILAPRNTLVHAVQDGTVAKLFVSKAGGNTIYQFDPSGRLCYYYAHLQRYADGLHEGDAIKQGQVIGYVGTSGNAPPNTPHLHFAVFELGPERQWWRGTPLDPYVVFRHTSPRTSPQP